MKKSKILMYWLLMLPCGAVAMNNNQVAASNGENPPLVVGIEEGNYGYYNGQQSLYQNPFNVSPYNNNCPLFPFPCSCNQNSSASNQVSQGYISPYPSLLHLRIRITPASVDNNGSLNLKKMLLALCCCNKK
ncbi:MAG: hypothetical protein WBQ73_03920 [Candidatus Babeliales bacterium]